MPTRTPPDARSCGEQPLSEPERCQHVGGDDLRELVGQDVSEGQHRAELARVVDEQVEPAEATYRLGELILVTRVADIAGDRGGEGEASGRTGEHIAGGRP